MQHWNLNKRLFFVLITILLVLSFASCSLGVSAGNSYRPNGDNTGNGTEQKVVANVEIRDGDIYILYTDGTENRIGSTEVNQTVNNNTITIHPDGVESSALTAAQAILSSVQITCTLTGYTYVRTSKGWEQTETDITQGGSGVILDLDKENGDAYIITNYHVVYNSDAIEENHICQKYVLQLYGESSMITEASYVGGSPNYDIAVLKIENSSVIKTSAVQAVKVASSNGIHVGENVLVCGNAEGLGISCTSGIISVESEYITLSGLGGTNAPMSYRVMRVDSAINSGNSGGGLFNSKGELIGIVNAKVSSTSIEGIGYALPSSVAVAIAQNIIDYQNGHVMRCIVGMTMSNNSSHLVYDTETGLTHSESVVTVESIVEGGLADQMGIRAADQITRIQIQERDPVEVIQTYSLIDEMLNARVGDVVTITLVRAGKTQNVSITLTDTCLTQY